MTDLTISTTDAELHAYLALEGGAWTFSPRDGRVAQFTYLRDRLVNGGPFYRFAYDVIPPLQQ